MQTWLLEDVDLKEQQAELRMGRKVIWVKGTAGVKTLREENEAAASRQLV